MAYFIDVVHSFGMFKDKTSANKFKSMLPKSSNATFTPLRTYKTGFKFTVVQKFSASTKAQKDAAVSSIKKSAPKAQVKVSYKK